MQIPQIGLTREPLMLFKRFSHVIISEHCQIILNLACAALVATLSWPVSCVGAEDIAAA